MTNMTISPTPPGSHINDSSPPKPLGAAPGSRFYVPELDVVRLFAFLSVFSFHVHFVPVVVWKPGLARSAALAGSVGVDLFFTL
ncbi:MAG TPA: hypothetical protein VMT58_09085, partial [Candidatus Binataceae bacterium]|nr:hypothetical protein [Candidatus Binataceae bacterium]